MKVMTIILLALIASFANPASATDVGISVSIGQPSFYGRLDVSDYPQPQVIYLQPRMVERVARDHKPIYLHVPPGYARNWRRHCDEYDACGERVYFVKDSWYDREYAPSYREQHHDNEYGHSYRHYNNYQNDHYKRGEYSNDDNHDEDDDY